MKRKALFALKARDGIRCVLCPHACLLSEGETGLCGVRSVEQGELMTSTYGMVVAGTPDPIEKKPLYHFLPGTKSFSIATPGCNMFCKWCQNHHISQMPFDDPDNWAKLSAHQGVKPEDVVRAALSAGCRSISYTYTEPTIFYEFALDTMKLAKKNGLANVWVTNGFISPKALLRLEGLLDAANIDLKFNDPQAMRDWTRAWPGPVKIAAKTMKSMGVWVEMTTLLIPGVNDSSTELREMAGFISQELGPDTPWHISGFYPAYKATHLSPTSLDDIKRAVEAGYEAGLRFIYPGNTGLEVDTVCPVCGHTLIKRRGFRVVENNLYRGKCPACGSVVAGMWEI